VSVSKIVVDTDVLLDFLMFSQGRTGSGSHPLLRRLLAEVFCYTTVFNAAELFSLMRTKKEESAAEDALGAVKLLGVNARSAKQMGPLIRPRNGRRPDVLAALNGTLCRETRLPPRYGAAGSVSRDARAPTDPRPETAAGWSP
jgi:hypothetical protein